jgi:hypothetical protein
MKRHELINWFIQTWNYRAYLEIGVDNPSKCFDHIAAPVKVGVDPAVGKTIAGHHYRETSDSFFSHSQMRFDIIFIDGLHVCDQVLRDVEHSLQALNPGGSIIMHDCMPSDPETATATRQSRKPWYGTVWQAWAALRATKEGLEMRCVLADCGMGIIRRGRQDLYAGPRETFNDYLVHRTEMMSPITIGQVKLLYGRPV